MSLTKGPGRAMTPQVLTLLTLRLNEKRPRRVTSSKELSREKTSAEVAGTGNVRSGLRCARSIDQQAAASNMKFPQVQVQASSK